MDRHHAVQQRKLLVRPAGLVHQFGPPQTGSEMVLAVQRLVEDPCVLPIGFLQPAEGFLAFAHPVSHRFRQRGVGVLQKVGLVLLERHLPHAAGENAVRELELFLGFQRHGGEDQRGQRQRNKTASDGHHEPFVLSARPAAKETFQMSDLRHKSSTLITCS